MHLNWSLESHTTRAQAIQIFRAKADREGRDTLATSLATQFGITAKAVRDIWNLRTWAQTTRPCWTQADHGHFLAMPCSVKDLCDQCRALEVRFRSEACDKCAGPPRRGRPRKQIVAAGAGAISSAGTLSQIASDGRFGVGPDPKVCAAVHDILAETALLARLHTSECSIEEHLLSPMLESHKESAGEESEPLLFPMLESHEESADSAATMLSRQGNASACAEDSDIFRWMELDDEEEDVLL